MTHSSTCPVTHGQSTCRCQSPRTANVQMDGYDLAPTGGAERARLRELTAEYRAMLAANRYMANFGEMRRGVEAVLLPVGNADAIERLMRDLVAFGFGMGAEPRNFPEWQERADVAQAKLREHFAAATQEPR